MATESYQTQLERVQTAIAKIEESAQTVSVNGRSYTRADLETLYTREKWLRKQADREGKGGIRMKGGLPV